MTDHNESGRSHNTPSAPKDGDGLPAYLQTPRTAKPSNHRRHSRFVALMKIALPGAALAILAVIVAWPQIEEQSFGTPTSYVEPDAGETRVMAPHYEGTDDDDQPYIIKADEAISPNQENSRVSMNRPEAEITLNSGRFVTLSSDNALYQESDEDLYLDENVRLTRDDGFVFLTNAARAFLNQGRVEGDQPVWGQGPRGTVEGEGFRIEDDGDTIIFTGKSKLILNGKTESQDP